MLLQRIFQYLFFKKHWPLFCLQISSDTFYDFEDGDTRNLELRLLVADGLDVPPGDWLQMDTQTQTLLGTPGTHDVGIHQYILVAMDTGGKIAKDVFQVTVLSGT